MQSMLVAIILALVVVGILFPLFRRDLHATKTSLQGQKPETLFTRYLQKMKDYLKND
jgi:hypothetical protein